MDFMETTWRFGAALGIGLLIGLERERRKGRGEGRGAAGVRTFALTALLGALVVATGIQPLVVTAALFVAAAVLVSYALGPREDPGLTSEVALVVTFVLGALSQSNATLAAGVAVVVTALLASRSQLHRLVRDVISESELRDLLLFTAAVLVVLPLVPDRDLGPFGGINPRVVWRLVVLVMAAGGAGYLSLRLLGPRFGLPLAGLAGGFVSSAATIASMGSLARKEPATHSGAVAGAVLSSLATIVQLAVILGATSPELLKTVAPALVASGVTALAFAGVAMWRLRKQEPAASAVNSGRAFDMKGALIFALAISLVTLVASAAQEWLGDGAVPVTAGLAGFADAHAAAAAMAALVAGGKADPSMAALAVLLGLTTNTFTKAVAAFATGGRSFATPVFIGLSAIVLAAWAGLLVGQLLGW